VFIEIGFHSGIFAEACHWLSQCVGTIDAAPCCTGKTSGTQHGVVRSTLFEFQRRQILLLGGVESHHFDNVLLLIGDAYAHFLVHRLGQNRVDRLGRGDFPEVTRGVGMEGMGAPRARFLCPPEIVLWEISGTG
jgi:hypothetical protein